MATTQDGPLTGQGLVVWQGAPKKLRFVVADPDGVLVGDTGSWWVGNVPAVGACVADTPGAYRRAGLTGVADGHGSTVYAFTIAKGELAQFPPRGGYQHELWVKEPGDDPYPSSTGPLTIQPTIGGGAA